MGDTGRELGYSTADWYYRGVLVLAVAGLPLLYRRSPRPQRRIVFTIFGAVLVIPLLLWGNPRFHQPLVPLMALSAGALTVALAERVLGRRTGRGVGPSAGVDESDRTGASGADRAGPPGEASLAEEAEATGADKLEATGEAQAAAEGDRAGGAGEADDAGSDGADRATGDADGVASGSTEGAAVGH